MIQQMSKPTLKNASKKDMVEQKRNTSFTETKLQINGKLDALAKLYEIAGDEWMENNMK